MFFRLLVWTHVLYYRESSQFKYIHGNTSFLSKIAAFGNVNEAIRIAIFLENFFVNKLPIVTNPSTKVYHRVISLREWIKYHNWSGE